MKNTLGSFSSDTIANSVGEFIDNPEEGTTFLPIFEDIFKECKNWNDQKIRLFLRKLVTAKHKKYCSYILPK